MVGHISQEFGLTKTKSKSKLAGPKAAPLVRKQMEFKIFDHLLCKVKNTKSRFINIQCSRPAASTIQLFHSVSILERTTVRQKCSLVGFELEVATPS